MSHLWTTYLHTYLFYESVSPRLPLIRNKWVINLLSNDSVGCLFSHMLYSTLPFTMFLYILSYFVTF